MRYVDVFLDCILESHVQRSCNSDVTEEHLVNRVRL
jgi:hypothetical protein